MQARNVVLGLVGAVLVTVGAAFLITALWTLLAERFDAKVASLVIGGIFLGFGLIVLALRGGNRPMPVAAMTDAQRAAAAAGRPFGPRGAYPALMEAFMLGVTTYLQIRAARRRR
ncbi:MAG: hypothetical protein ACK4RN_13140 [Pseudorhodobacter sp.]